jgi:RIO kinase 1
MDAFELPTRPRPAWVITEDFVDETLGVLKTGKEAEVFVVERTSGSRSCLLAHKRYRPRKVGKGELQALGFQRAPTFRNDSVYRDGRRFAKSRDQRAVERMTGYGKELLRARWEGHELEIMTRVWEAGGDVPYPVGASGDGMLMEYIGDTEHAAPRLAQADIDRADAPRLFDRLIDNVRLMLEIGVVHSDLSPFNVLVWEGEPYLIDFPQAVDLAVNHHGLEFLRRDVERLAAFFVRRGDERDTEGLVAQLMDQAYRQW